MKFSWQSIGSIYAFMLLPFVLLSYPLGKLSDKLGEKNILIIGFLIGTLATLSIPLITLPVAWIFAIVLFFTRVGASTIEVMSESYFFKIVKEEDADEIAFFRNTRAVAFLIAPAIATLLLIFVPSFQYLFYVLGAVLLIGLWITLRMEDVK
jgi:MFS family permease